MSLQRRIEPWHCPGDPLVIACVPYPGLDDPHPIVSKYRWARIVNVPSGCIKNAPPKTIPYAVCESFGFYNGCMGPPLRIGFSRRTSKKKRYSLHDRLRELHKAKLGVIGEFEKKGVTRSGIRELLLFLASRRLVYLCYIFCDEEGQCVLPSNISWCKMSVDDAVNLWPFLFDEQCRKFVLIKKE